MNPEQAQTLTKADLESHLQTQIQQMDAAYGSAGYTRVGNSYVRNPQTDAALGVIGQNQGQQVVPQDASTLQGYVDTQTGQPPPPSTTQGQLNSGQYQIKPKLSDAQQTNLSDTTTALQTINTLQGLINDNGKNIRFGRAQAPEAFLRKYLGPNFPGLGQNSSEQQFDDLVNQLSAHLINTVAGVRGESSSGGVAGTLDTLFGQGGSGLAQFRKTLPSRSDTPQETQNKLQTLQSELLAGQKNTLGASVSPTNQATSQSLPVVDNPQTIGKYQVKVIK